MTVAPLRSPFAASRTRPGTLPYIFHTGTLEELVWQFRKVGKCGQIVGPHGSGKTTLLIALVRHLEAAGDRVHLVRLPARDHPGFRDAERQLRRTLRTLENAVLAVDGWDQLSLRSRILVSLSVRARRVGLLITTHRQVRMPLLIQTTTTLQSAKTVVARLLDQANLDRDCREWVEATVSADLPELIKAHRGNLREVLFALYDRFERSP
jgi:hypothetical protein